MPYWTPQQAVGLGPDVFYDWSHLNSSTAQKRMAIELADRIADELSHPATTNVAERCIHVGRRAGVE